MKNILNFIDQWGLRITFLLVLIVFMKTCTTNGKVERVEKRITQKTEKLDSLLKKVDGKIVTEEKLIKLIKETPNWKTLELEELSDNNRIPINKLKNDNEK